MTVGTGPVTWLADEWQVRLGRQGIYDRAGHLVGHELLFRGISDQAAELDSAVPRDVRGRRIDTTVGDHATSQIIAATFGDFGVHELSGGLPLFLNLTRAFIVGELPLPFGAEGVVLEVLEDILVDDEVLAGLRHLRSRGFRIALDDFIGEPSRLELLSEVDVVKVDVLGLTCSIEDVVALCREHAPLARLLAEKVEDEATLEVCRAAGFELFQGFHFQRPTLLETSRMPPSDVMCLRLLRTLVDPNASTADIEQVVAGDPGLTLRVLRSANSASAAPRHKVKSLRQAVVLLGPPALSAWVTLTLLGGLSPGTRTDLVTVLARAACCEALAEQSGADPSESSAAYLAGMLSGVAQVIHADAGQVAVGAGLDEELVDALDSGAGHLGQMVSMVLANENGQSISAHAHERYGVTDNDVSRLYLQAWSSALARVSDVLGSH